MRLAPALLLALPALSLADEQAPLLDRLKGFINKATAAISSTVPSIVPNPIDAGASKVAQALVHRLNLTNWKDVLTPDATAQSDGPEEWMVYFEGGNKTCWGLCGNATKAWNASTALLAASSNAPKLASVDCDQDPVLCNMWLATPPSIYHVLLPKPLADQSKPATTVRYFQLNTTTVTAKVIAELHTQEKYKETAPYEGYWQPFDGLLAKTGLNLPLAYVLWGFGKMPSWLPMIVISFFTRTFIGRRTVRPQPPLPGAAGAQRPAQ
jgi:hypothetical protein